MQIQQPNVATFAKADHNLLQQMSDNDDAIKNEIEKAPKGVITLGLLDNVATNIPNYSAGFGGVYQQHNSVNWLSAVFIDPKTSRLTTNFESNRYYKFTVHLDYVWAANKDFANLVAGNDGLSGRIEIRLRDMTHRHDLLYWTNVVDPDYNMGGVTSPENYIALRDKTYDANVNIWAWDQASARGAVPSSCHAVRVMAAKTSGAAILQLQYRPMKAYGGIVPPETMDCSGASQPIYSLPTQYIDNSGVANKTESIKQFKGYVSVEDCGPTEKPAGVEPGVQNDNSVSPLFEAYENHPYDATNPGRP